MVESISDHTLCDRCTDGTFLLGDVMIEDGVFIALGVFVAIVASFFFGAGLLTGFLIWG